MSKFNPLIETQADNFAIPEVGSWSTDKWSLMGAYCNIFTTGMRNIWDKLVYVDLYSGAGFAKIKGSDRIYYSSSLIALSAPIKFDKYIFCEKDPELMEGLQNRAQRLFPNSDVSFVSGDANEKIETIKSLMPAYRRGNTRLAFCFVDPFSLDLNFKTIESLGKDKIDFLILLALHMDANRNLIHYLDENSSKIENFTNDPRWRNTFSKFGSTGKEFIRFLAEKYDKNMMNLGYVKPANKHLVKSSNKNLPLYYLAFYSKHKRGNDFYKKVKQTATGQIELGL